jgi:hypothetical protein
MQKSMVQNIYTSSKAYVNVVCKIIPSEEDEESTSLWYRITIYPRHLALTSLSPNGVVSDENNTVLRRSQ